MLASILTLLIVSHHTYITGDHKQLRPKVEQYSLRVESGRGFDLNVSLFERLVKNGYPHTTLELQHRMPPEVSHRPLPQQALAVTNSTMIGRFKRKTMFASQRMPARFTLSLSDRTDWPDIEKYIRPIPHRCRTKNKQLTSLRPPRMPAHRSWEALCAIAPYLTYFKVFK